MVLSRENWLRSVLLALVVVITPASSATLLAQGYGPDPFRPYNSQYDAYAYPMGSASPAAGGSGAMPRMGNMGANQYQGYLDELSGTGRQGTERYGIGVPYYRSSVDPNFDPKGTRDYRPNYNADRSFEQSHEVITRKYLAYFTEKDPKKRAELLRDYNQTRNRVSRAMSGRRENPSRALEAASGTGGERRRTPTAARGADDEGFGGYKPRLSPRLSGRDSSTDGSRRASVGTIPPPPAIPGLNNTRRTTPRRTPNEVLERSRRFDNGRDVKPSTGASTGTDSGTARQPLPTPPPPQ
jgi:hypothetical protein